MSDNLSIRRPLDSSRVNINQDYEVNFWCKEFGCTKAELVQAVKAVGTSVVAVRNYLA